MPLLEQTSTNRDALQERFVNELLAEWQNPSETARFPLIIVEREAENQPAKHLLVVWDKWSDLTSLQRSRVVMRAYERFLGSRAADAAQITLAMGYLPDEARRLGIEIDN